MIIEWVDYIVISVALAFGGLNACEECVVWILISETESYAEALSKVG